MNTSLSADERATLVLKEMTLDEKISLLHGTGMAGLGPRSPLAAESRLVPPPAMAPLPPPLPAPAPELPPLSRRSRPEVPADPLASAAPPRPAMSSATTSWLTELPETTTPKPAGVNGNGHGPPPVAGDDSLSEQEKHLLRQLQEELARREQEESNEVRGRHGGQQNRTYTFDWPTASDPTMINGIPPQPPDPRR